MGDARGDRREGHWESERGGGRGERERDGGETEATEQRERWRYHHLSNSTGHKDCIRGAAQTAEAARSAALMRPRAGMHFRCEFMWQRAER